MTISPPAAVIELESAEPLAGNYFVAAYPPFSHWNQSAAIEICQSLQSLKPQANVPFGIYFHLPFCAQRCHYCYYLAIAGASAPQMERYAQRLVGEAENYRKLPYFEARPPGFVYFGGGTPSLLRAELLRQLFLRLKAGFPWAEAEEVTFECAPRSISKEKVAILHEAGVDRLSLGVQQLDNDVLRLNGRFHLVDDVLRAWKLIRQREFAEVNVDLIVGLRGETEVSFFRSLEQVIGLGPDCITLYQLEIPRNTPLCGAIGDENVAAQLPDWETKRSRLARAFERLEREGYQVRNAYSAARGTRHPHFAYAEQQYHGADLIGLGLSSFSYVAGIHYQNTTSAEEYAAAVDASLLPIARSYRLDREEQMVRELVLQLKLGHVNRPYFRRKFGVDPLVRFARPIEACAERGWMQWSDGWIELTREGLVRADRLLPAFYLARHRGQPYW